MQIKFIIPLLSLFFLHDYTFAQQNPTVLTNIQAGLWSNPQDWILNAVPDSSDDVVLSNNIVIDVNATCHSLTTNGYTVTINTGQKLTITGDSVSAVEDNDTLLSEIVDIDVDDLGQVDTAYIKYQYDNEKRVTGYTNMDGDGGDTTIETYFYSGSNTLPFKAISIFSDGDPSELEYDTSYLTYNNSGLIIEDSGSYFFPEAGYTPYIEKDIYTINANYISEADITYNYGSDPVTSSDTVKYNYYQTLQNGNIVFETLSINDDIDTFNFSYDSTINPIYKASLHYPVYFEEHLFFDDPQPKNNMTYENQVTPSLDELYGFTTKYLYKTNHLPSAAVLKELYASPEYGITQYYYTH